MDAVPDDFLTHVNIGEYPIKDSIAWDTETSGLYPDDGARVSTVSIAFVDHEVEWREFAERYDNVVYQLEEIAPGYEVYIISCAWPFDQGVNGKPEDIGQFGLWETTENLDEDEWDALMYLLNDNALDAHNALFDALLTQVGCRRWPGKGRNLIDNVVWDTQNVTHMLYPTFEGTSLKPTVARIFGKEWADEKEVVAKYLRKHKLPVGRWDLIPWEVIGKYAETDARITKMLKLRQIWDIEHGACSWFYDKLTDEERETRESLGLDDFDMVYDKINRRLEVMKILYWKERRGIPYDEVESREAGLECLERAKEIEKDLPFGPTGDKAKKFFFGDGRSDRGVPTLGHIPYATSPKTGAPSLTAEILGRMVADGIPFADKWLDWNKVDNAASMWYIGYADKMGQDGRLRCRYRQNGTRSSRYSVERINLQAIPQDYRLSEFPILEGLPTPRQIIANAVPGGWRLYELDLAQAELRVGTMFAGCQLMRQMIEEGEDLHTFTTKYLFPDEDPEGPLFKSKWRQVGKRGNFSLQFGAKGATFKAMVSKETGIVLSETESDRVVREWNALYPEFDRAIRRHQNVVTRRQAKHKYGWIEYVNGERRWFQPYEEAHKAFNQRVQGNLGQFGIEWLLRTEPFLRAQDELHRRADKEWIGMVGLLLTIHDSQMLLLPDDDYGRSLAETCANFGKTLWKEMFPGIPGDVDYHAWDRTNA